MASRRKLIEAFGVAAVAVLVLAARAPFAMSKLWAEDGTVFLQQPIDRGIARSFGQGYAGYYLFIPRVIGAVASALPLRAAALTTWIGVAVVIGWCAATIYRESERWLETVPTRALLALSIVLLPALGLEAIANASDLQYTLLFTALVALIGTTPGRWAAVNRVAIVGLTALTTPLTLLLAPLAVLRAVRLRPRRIDATIVAWGVATAVQFGMILIEHPPRDIGKPGNKRKILSHYDHRVLYANLLPKRIANSSLAPLAMIVGGCLVILAAVLAWRRTRRARAVHIVLVPTIGLAFWIFAGTHYGLPARYRVFPALCVIWAGLVAWEELVRARRPRAPVDWRLAGVVVVLLGVVWVGYWRPVAYRSSGPRWSNALAVAEARCTKSHRLGVAVRISPAGPGAGFWAMRRLQCRDLS